MAVAGDVLLREVDTRRFSGNLQRLLRGIDEVGIIQSKSIGEVGQSEEVATEVVVLQRRYGGDVNLREFVVRHVHSLEQFTVVDGQLGELIVREVEGEQRIGIADGDVGNVVVAQVEMLNRSNLIEGERVEFVVARVEMGEMPLVEVAGRAFERELGQVVATNIDCPQLVVVAEVDAVEICVLQLDGTEVGEIGEVDGGNVQAIAVEGGDVFILRHEDAYVGIAVTHALHIRSGGDFVRDHLVDEGAVAEVHFDRDGASDRSVLHTHAQFHRCAGGGNGREVDGFDVFAKIGGTSHGEGLSDHIVVLEDGVVVAEHHLPVGGFEKGDFAVLVFVVALIEGHHVDGVVLGDAEQAGQGHCASTEHTAAEVDDIAHLVGVVEDEGMLIIVVLIPRAGVEGQRGEVHIVTTEIDDVEVLVVAHIETSEVVVVAREGEEFGVLADVETGKVVAGTVEVVELRVVGEVDLVKLHIGVHRSRSVRHVEFTQIGVLAQIERLDTGVADIEYTELWVFRDINAFYFRHVQTQTLQLGALRRIGRQQVGAVEGIERDERGEVLQVEVRRHVFALCHFEHDEFGKFANHQWSFARKGIVAKVDELQVLKMVDVQCLDGVVLQVEDMEIQVLVKLDLVDAAARGSEVVNLFGIAINLDHSFARYGAGVVCGLHILFA